MREWVRKATWVDHFLLILRLSVVAIVAMGIVSGLLDPKYSARDWLSFFLFGLTLGGVYALISLGYTMVYGILRMINMAHGDVMMLGAFSGMFAANAVSSVAGNGDGVSIAFLPFVFAVAMGVSALASMMVERVASRPFLHVRSLAPLICALGFSFIISYSVRGFFGARNRAFPSFLELDRQVSFLGIDVPLSQIVALIAAVLMLIGLVCIVRFTRLGTAMRAVSEDRDAAALMGIDVGRTIVATFAIGGAMAGAAGVLYGLVFTQIQVFMGFFLGVKGFAAAILGGIGNLPGAMLGGLIIGLAEAMGPALLLEGLQIPAPYQLKDVIGYSMLVLVLIFRPQGLLGERLSTKRA